MNIYDEYRKKAAEDLITKGMDVLTAEKLLQTNLEHLKPQNIPTANDGFYFVETKFYNGHAHQTKKPDYYGLAKYFKDFLHFKSAESFCYVYKDEYFHQVGQIELKNMVIKLTLEQAKNHELESFCKIIRSYCFLSDDGFAQTEGMLNLKNGTLHIQSGVLLDHSPKYFFKYKLPHEFNKEAKCDEWLKFLSFIFEGRKELIDLSAEIFGYALSGGYPWLHKAFVLYGEGRNGKSTFIDVLKKIIGRDNYSTIPMHQLNRPFSVVMADGKLANIVGETSSSIEIESDAFKTAVGGEELVASHKGMPEYSMPFWAKMFFAANKLPNFKDSTAGNYEKLCIIPFNRYIKEDERDPMISEKLYPEIPGIINWAIDGYKRLLERKKLPKIDIVKDVLEEYRIESDSVFHWASEHVVYDANCLDVMFVKDLYQEYVTFCAQSGRHKTSLIGFCRKILAEMKKKETVSLLSSREGVKIIGGVKIKKNSNFSGAYTKFLESNNR